MAYQPTWAQKSTIFGITSAGRRSPRFRMFASVVRCSRSYAQDEWVHQRVTESESDDESVEALTVRTPLQ